MARSVARIKAGKIESHFRGICKSHLPETGIYQIGPKIAAFYLRDLVTLFGLETFVADEFQYCLQPVDVWVRKVAITKPILWLRTHRIISSSLKSSACAKSTVARHLQFNQGAGLFRRSLGNWVTSDNGLEGNEQRYALFSEGGRLTAQAKSG